VLRAAAMPKICRSFSAPAHGHRAFGRPDSPALPARGRADPWAHDAGAFRGEVRWTDASGRGTLKGAARPLTVY